jgi:hypothetical protein
MCEAMVIAEVGDEQRREAPTARLSIVPMEACCAGRVAAPYETAGL